MKLCGSVNWCKIGWLVVTINLLFVSTIAWSQNVPPVLNTGIPNQHTEVGSTFSYTIPSTAFKDLNGDNLTYTATSSPAGVSISGRTISVTPGAEGSIAVTVTANDGNGGIASKLFTIFVHPAGGTYAAFTMNTNMGCGSLSVRFENKSSINVSRWWDWDLGNGNHSPYASPFAIYSEPGSYVVTLTVKDETDQTYTYTDVVNVYKSPVPSIDRSTFKSDCEPYGVTLFSNGDAGVYYHWYSEEFPVPINRYTIPGTINLINLPNNRYYVSLEVTDANGCTGLVPYQPLFEVYDKPIASFTYDKTDKCKASITNFYNTSTISGSTISGHLWTVDGILAGTDKDLIYDFTSKPGPHIVSLTETSVNNCISDTYTDTIKFNNGNSANFGFAPTPVCLGTAITFTPFVSSGIIGYDWVFEGINHKSEASPTWNFNTAGHNSAQLTATFSDGCVITTPSKPVPIDEVTPVIKDSVSGTCLNIFTLYLSDNSTSAIGAEITSVKWYRDNLSNGNFQLINPPLTGLNAGTYRIKLVAADATGCTDSIVKDITISSSTLSFTASGATSGCSGAGATNFSANFQSVYDNALNYTWDFGDTNVGNGKTITHTYATGNFDVKLTVTTANGCTFDSKMTNAIQFANQPVIDSVSFTQANYCLKTGVDFHTYFKPATTDQLQYVTSENPSKTEFIDGVSGTSYTYTHAFENIGNSSLTVTAVDNGCPSTPFTVNNIRTDGPKADFYTTATSFCNVHNVQFVNSTTTNGATPTYSWDFGDLNTSTLTSPEHTYAIAGNYPVTVTATDPISGCFNSIQKPISIFSFDNSTNDIISATNTSGCARPGLDVSFSTDFATKISSNYSNYNLGWDFDANGSIDSVTTASTINHSYTQSGIYTARLHVTGNGCDFITDYSPINVLGPKVNFNISSPVCSGFPVTFTNLSTQPAGGTVDRYSWNFGDGNKSDLKDPEHTFTDDSNYTVSLKITDSNSCSDTLSKTIHIKPFTALFSVDNSVICIGNFVNFTNSSTGSGLTYKLAFGDGETSSVPSVAHKYKLAGDFTSTLEVTTVNGCTKVDSQSIHVVNVTADFSGVKRDLGCAPADGSFIPDAIDADVTSYLWSFGDGITSEERAPTHRYYTPGTYTVSLSIVFTNGCDSTVTKSDYITVKGAFGELNYIASKSCAPDSVQFTLTKMSKVDKIQWDFGNGARQEDIISGDTTFSTTYTYTKAGYTKPSVMLTSNECMKNYAYEKNSVDLINDPVRIYTSTPPVASFSVNYNDICEGIPIQFTDRSLRTDSLYPASSWHWNFGDADRSTDTLHQNPVHAYKQVASISPQLIISNSLGCSDTTTLTNGIYIHNRSEIQDTIVFPENNNTLVCPGSPVNFRGSATTKNEPIISWKWDFRNGDTSIVQNSTHIFEKDLRGQSIEVMLVATDEKLCSDSTIRTVAINSLQAALGYLPQQVHRGVSVDFGDSSKTSSGDRVKSWKWNFENSSPPGTSIAQNPKNISYENINEDGNSVTLIVGSELGCTDTTQVSLPVLNNPPTVQSFNMIALINTRCNFSIQDFESHFTDKDSEVGQKLEGIQIVSLPSYGDLYLGNSIISGPITISRFDIGNLNYRSANEGSDNFLWNGTDGIDYAGDTATVYIKVNPIPPPPTLSDLVFNIREDSVLTFSLNTFKDHFTDSLMFDGFGLDILRVITIPTLAQGKLTYLSSEVHEGDEFDTTKIRTGAFTVTPTTGYDGKIIFDWNGFDSLKWGVSPAKVIINYRNSIPVLDTIVRDNLKKNMVQTILKKEFLEHYRDSDRYDTATTFYLDIPSGLRGTFKINNDITVTGTNSIAFKQLDSVVFIPETGFDGWVEVPWGASDGQNTGNASIRFHFVNAPPVSHNVELLGTEDTPLLFSDVKANLKFRNSFLDDDKDPLQKIMITSLPEKGSLTFYLDSFTTPSEYYDIQYPPINGLRYTPSKDWNGKTSFTYKAYDGTDWSNEATVLITIAAVNDPPVPKNDLYTIYEDSILSGVNVMANDTDVDDPKDNLKVSLSDKGTAGDNGKITLRSNGELKYEPNHNFNDTVSFTYSLCDTSKACASARVTIVIIPVNDPPTAVNDTITIFDNTKFYSSVDTTRLLYNDWDPESDSIYISRIGKGYPGDTILGNSGKIIARRDGNFTYYPDSAKVISLDENQVLIDSFKYVVSDLPGLTDSAWLMIRIFGLNSPPHAVNDTVWVDQNQIIKFNPDSTLLTKDSDPESNPISITRMNSDSTGLINGTTGILKWKTDGEFYYKQGENNNLFDYLAEGDTTKVEFTYRLEDSHKAAAYAKLVIIIKGKNDPPVARPDTSILLATDVSVASNSKIYLLYNDTDIDRGDSIHVSKVNDSAIDSTQGNYGWLLWYGNGNYTYFNDKKATISLPAGKKANDVFSYTISDRMGATATSKLTILITGVNSNPNAKNDILKMHEHDISGSLVAGTNGLLDNVTDVNDDALTVIKVNDTTQKTFSTTYGNLTWDMLGNVLFVINDSLVASMQVGDTVTETFSYVASDPYGGTATAQLIIMILGQNDNPVAVNDSVTITEDTPSVSGADSTSLISHDWDVEGDPIFVTLVNGKPDSVAIGLHGYGELHWNSSGSYTYYTYHALTDTLAQGEIATDRFAYTLSDNHGGTDTASFIVVIQGLNDPPVAVPDSNTTTDIFPIVVSSTDTKNVLRNDYDIDSHSKIKLTAVNESADTVTLGRYGTLSWDTTGSYTYRPDSSLISLRAREQRTDSFVYTIEDEYHASDSTLLQLTIVGINNAPAAKNDTLRVEENDISKQLPPPGLLAPKNVQDPDNHDTLKVLLMNGSKNDSIPGIYGSLRWDSAGNITYIPYPLLIHKLRYGEYVTDPFSYTIADKGGLTAHASLIVRITGENSPITAYDDTLTINEDSYGKRNVVANDVDIDNGGMINFDLNSLTILEGPNHGKAYRNSATGEIYYFPNKDFNGKDSLKYRICDTGEPVYCDEAWLKIEVRPVNDPPVATNLVLKTPMNIPVGFEYQKQVTDIDDGINPNSLVLPVNPKIKKNGAFIIYTPAKDSTGIDEFTYSMKDYTGAAAYVIVTVIVGDTLSDFRAQDDYISTNEETPVDIFILENDTVGGETPDPRTVEIKVFPKNGVAIFDPGKQVINYQPDKNFNGADSLEYIVSSGPGNWSSAKVFITVVPVNDPIVATDDLDETFINKPVTISVLANDYDTDNGIDTTSFKILQPPKLGTASFNFTTGKLNYTSTSAIGIDTLVYKICDLNKTETSCDSALVIILVKSESSGFTAKNDNYTTDENKQLNLVKPTPWANDKNIDPNIFTDSTSFKLLNGPLHGGETINPDYTVTYTPETNYYGPDWMEYIISDSAGNWDKAEINIWVNEVNIAPVAVDDTAIVTKNEPKRLYVLENDYDLDGTLDWSRLSIPTGKGPKNGVAEIDKNTGTILYKPSINTGVDQFTYRIYDNKGKYDEATVYITIELETTIYIRRSTNEDTPITINVATEMVKYNLTFPINTIIQEIAPKLGAWSFGNNNRDLTYTPDLNLNGSDTIWLNVWSKDKSEFASLRIFINIIPVNDAPVAVDDTIHWINAPGAKVITFDSLLVNDYDVDYDSIRFTSRFMKKGFIEKGYPGLNIAVDSIKHTISITADTILWCNTWFTYEITDGILTDTATVFIWPELNGIIANNDKDSLNENSSKKMDVLANDIFKDNQRCTIDSIIVITPPKHGTAIGTSDNYVDYRPTRHYFGFDSLQYEIIDIWGQHSTAWVHIEVLEKNTPPVALADFVTATFGVVTNIPVLNNDFDPDAVGADGDPTAHIDSARTRLSFGSYPLYGSVVFNQATFNFVYTPDVTSCEPDSFQYTIYDNEGGSDSATVLITMTEAPLFANPDFKKTYPGVEAEVEPLLNDSGYFVPEWTTHTIPQTIHGTVNWNSQNIVTYIPDKSFIGRDSILYTLVSPCGNGQSTYIIFSVEELRVPEIISPNGDGKNDVLMIDGIEYFPDNLLQIYNRYGHVVYQKKGYLNEWGGYSNKGSLGGDKPLPAGTYYYTLIYNEGRNRQAGSIYIFW